ncbi:MAG: RuBisCO large subunit C-terminal-like domain-containing protein, partial [Gemmatimonadales bacterium]
MSGDRIAIRYRLTPAAGESAEQKARDIALEQTVELPEARYPTGIAERVVGRVESVVRADPGTWDARITYDTRLVGSELLSLANLVFGNISMKRGIRVVDLDLPASLLDRLGGPAFGIPGIRRLVGAEDGRPLVCAAAKPVGLSSSELAELCARFAEAGVDIVKDDHSLSDQEWAPFDERVARCQEAVVKANARTGSRTRYFPNLLGAPDAILARLETARAAGCQGVVVAPLAVGIGMVQEITRRAGMTVLAHPMLS